ncbi:P-loop ATPase, Sll1717 family [Ruminococcus flavefaciens]|uniref:Uncharacterized protein DUF4062 n=1 Tax=Ruminococcus flavefaciens TaxID=1265 RepID=A0A315XUE0_RUMFL|nr:DUF4062 domain-containing protein [Ruminococcus flavefaciens]PWJ10269.1 uncharacterized protein DUF4062 [Ruminococcus flavefaciens]SSA52009.1 protein of unknown function [Ruminococcus flavefaciens]
MCIWRVSADNISFSDETIMNLLYYNNQVATFMNSNSSKGIAGCKGMGKTFLLKAKRIKLQNESNNSVLILPKDRMVDASGSLPLDNVHISFLSSYGNWRSLWISCIAIYLLSQEEFEDLRRNELEVNNCKKYLSDFTLNLLEEKHIGVFSVLHKIIAINDKAILRLIVKDSTILFDIVQKIQSQVAMFIDKLEEPFNADFFRIPGANNSTQGKYNYSIWAYAQLAFADAVNTLFASRNHIKIYYSIRKEALYRGEEIAVDYSKIRDNIISLEYTREDLYKMFHGYIKNEDPENLCSPIDVIENPIKALIGVDRISHNSGESEPIWNYLYRHTFQRPRDIMEMCKSIHDHIVKNADVKNNIKDRTRVLRDWINELSKMECNSYLFFLDPFMKCQGDISYKEQIIDFIKELPTDVLNYELIKEHCCSKNDQKLDDECGECENIHYFSSLYNVGLIGRIHKSTHTLEYSCKIKHMGQSEFLTNSSSLPKEQLYYLHPGLANIAKSEREISGKNFLLCPFNSNDLDQTIPKDKIRYMIDSANSLLGNRSDKNVFLSSTGRDIGDKRKEIKRLLESMGYTVFAYEDPDFPSMDNEEYSDRQKGKTQDHCIDVMLRCKHIVYLFDKTFGGRYVGEKYRCYYEKEQVIKITPSVSFMEYLVAKENHKNVKVYVLKDVDIARGEYIANDCSEKFKSKVVQDNRVFEQLGYFNSLLNGTWYDTYNDIDDLKQYIIKQFNIPSI